MNKPVVEYIGNSKIPVIYIDNYISDINVVLDDVKTSTNFLPDENAFYPGVRSKLPEDYVQGCLSPLIAHLHSIYNIPRNLKPSSKGNYYSLITTEQKDLIPIQTFPHFDTLSPYLFAVLHYLSDGEHGGTGFFRHKQTQYEYVDESRKETYFDSVKTYLNGLESETLSYCSTTHSEYEFQKEIEFRQNRLAIYPGYTLHTTLVNCDNDINVDPLKGRLTANMFLEFS